MQVNCSDINAAPLRAFLPYATGAARTTNFTAALNLIYPVDVTSGTLQVTLPTTPQGDHLVGLVNTSTSGANMTLISGSDIQSTADTYAPGKGVTIGLRSGGALIWQYNTHLDIWLITNWQPSSPPA